ncbi:MAG: flippase [Candidatus Magasanikbacteria bacterium]|nr:flippase [Candidatus Magasanikbacteria bacterium]
MASTTKNTMFMITASIGQKLVAFVYFTLIARQLGAEGVGMYFFALSFTTIFVVFVDLGLNNVLIRESAKYKEKAQSYFSNVLFAKFILGIFAYIGVIIAINAMGYEMDIKSLVYLSGITMLFDSLHLSIYGILRAFGNLKYEAVGIVMSQTITFILGTFFLFNGYPLIFLMFAFLIPSMLNVFYSATVLYKKHKISLRPKYDKKVFIRLIQIAIPFAIAAIFARVYSYADSILLSKLAGNEAVGWYSIPYKITYAFQFVPLAFVAALYPRFSEYFVSDKKKLSELFEKSLRYLLIVVFPISVGIAVLAKDIILTIYTPEFSNSILPLQILVGSLIFSFISFPIGAFLNACDRQKIQTVIVGFVMVVNVGLNLILIPIYGVVGAAISALVGNILLAVLGYTIVPQVIKLKHSRIFKMFLKSAFSALIMGIFVWWTNIYINLFGAVLVGAVVYSVMVFATKTMTISQVKDAYFIFRKNKI